MPRLSTAVDLVTTFSPSSSDFTFPFSATNYLTIPTALDNNNGKINVQLLFKPFDSAVSHCAVHLG